jgi:hypothetical protein
MKQSVITEAYLLQLGKLTLIAVFGRRVYPVFSLGWRRTELKPSCLR